MSQVINVLSAPNKYPQISGGDPNGMLADFIRVNLYVTGAGIFWQWQRKTDNQWTLEIALNTGYYSFDRDGSGIQVRSQSASALATVTIELLEPDDFPDVFLTTQHA